MGTEFIVLNPRTGRWIDLHKCIPYHFVDHGMDQSREGEDAFRNYWLSKLLWGIKEGFFKEGCILLCSSNPNDERDWKCCIENSQNEIRVPRTED